MPRRPSQLPTPNGFGLPDAQAVIRLPLTGLTIMTVEDSRYASEALRLLCNRSGARLRRAETMEAARRHLSLYLPDVIIIDIGLPDGDGAELIYDLAQPGAFDGLILASSGDPNGIDAAMAAGAAGFLLKPLESLANFQDTIVQHLSGAPRKPQHDQQLAIRPDQQALHDDLCHAANLLARPDNGARRYVADFVRGLARSCHDHSLEEAARHAQNGPAGIQILLRALKERLASAPGAFAQSDGNAG